MQYNFKTLRTRTENNTGKDIFLRVKYWLYLRGEIMIDISSLFFLGIIKYSITRHHLSPIFFFFTLFSLHNAGWFTTCYVAQDSPEF